MLCCVVLCVCGGVGVGVGGGGGGVVLCCVVLCCVVLYVVVLVLVFMGLCVVCCGGDVMLVFIVFVCVFSKKKDRLSAETAESDDCRQICITVTVVFLWCVIRITLHLQLQLKFSKKAVGVPLQLQ